MLKSMTGYGRGEAVGDNSIVSIEIRSVNNRFCDVIMRSNKGFMKWDDEIKRLIQKRLDRGKIFCNVNVEVTKSNGEMSELDVEALKKYAGLLGEIKKHADIEEPIQLNHLLDNNSIFMHPTNEGFEELHGLMLEALEASLGEVSRMRSEEGEMLSTDIVERVTRVDMSVKEIEGMSENNVSTQFKKMKSRAEELLAGNMEERRLDHELALLADKLDISEECVRIRSHVEQFLNYVDIDEPVGKRLDFLLQEMNRETNTISSKTNEAKISHLIVEMKNGIESLREQVQNIV